MKLSFFINGGRKLLIQICPILIGLSLLSALNAQPVYIFYNLIDQDAEDFYIQPSGEVDLVSTGSVGTGQSYRHTKDLSRYTTPTDSISSLQAFTNNFRLYQMHSLPGEVHKLNDNRYAQFYTEGHFTDLRIFNLQNNTTQDVAFKGTLLSRNAIYRQGKFYLLMAPMPLKDSTGRPNYNELLSDTVFLARIDPMNLSIDTISIHRQPLNLPVRDFFHYRGLLRVDLQDSTWAIWRKTDTLLTYSFGQTDPLNQEFCRLCLELQYPKTELFYRPKDTIYRLEGLRKFPSRKPNQDVVVSKNWLQNDSLHSTYRFFRDASLKIDSSNNYPQGSEMLRDSLGNYYFHHLRSSGAGTNADLIHKFDRQGNLEWRIKTFFEDSVKGGIRKLKLDASGNLWAMGNVWGRVNAYGFQHYYPFVYKVDPTVNLTESPTVKSLSVFPNPSTGEIRIVQENSIQSVSVRDLQGKLWLQKEFSGTRSRENLDLNHLPAGMYLLQTQGASIKLITITD